MADYLRTRTDKLLLCNDKLALSCCGNTVQDIYWAAIPCGVDLNFRTTCDEVDQCQYINRYFISHKSLCQDDRLFVCECQRLYFKDYDTMEEGPKNNAFTISYTGPNMGKVEINSNSVILTENNGAGPVYSTGINGTLQNLSFFIDSLSNWEATNQIGPGIPIYILNSGIQNINSFSFKNFAASNSSFTLSYNGVSTDPIDFDLNPTTLASNIQTSLENDLDLFGVEVNYNENLTNGDVNKYFEIYFGGGLCGVSHSGIFIDKYKIISNNTFNSIRESVSGQYGEYRLGYGNQPEYWYNSNYVFGDSYNIRGSGSSFSDFDNFCAYEQDSDGDIRLYQSDLQCCPQKGAVLGKLQNLSNDYNTYLFDSTENIFSNLETTILINGQCYATSPFYFLFDRTGRFKNDPLNAQQPYITPDCDVNGGCTYDVPENCTVELFLAQFHKDIPWGPFGSYYPDIENRNHASLVLETGYIYDGFAGSPELFAGYQYAPNGSIITRGTWLNTDTIDIIFTFKRAMSFYLGSDPFLDKNQLGVVDPATVGSGLTIINNEDCGGPVFLRFACSGKTVRNFVDAINNVKTLAYDDYPSCNIFAFCLGSTEAGNVPASKIINISNELFDQARSVKNYNASLTYTSSFGGANPLTDVTVSKADIFVGPHKYSSMWPTKTQRSLADSSFYPQDRYENPLRFVTQPVTSLNTEKTQLPPFGRHRMYGLPKSLDYITFRQNDNGFGNPNEERKFTPWFTNIPGKLTNVNLVTFGSGIPDYINKIEFNCQDSVVNITITSGTTIIQSTGINTNKFGAEYKTSNLAEDINNLSFKDNPSDSPYWPVYSETLTPYDIWLDDSTFWDSTNFEPSVSGAVNAVETPENWSYKEPLINSENHNLFNSPIGYLKNWSRQRTEYIEDSFGARILELPMSGCRPLNSRVIEENETINCNGDEFIIGGTFANYGCDSEICKTEWYLKTTRCDCSNEAGCDNGPHLYNQPGNSQANKSTYGSYWITQPDLYICEYTFHPECDIPMLVKVPMQIVQNTDGNIYLAQYCGDSTYAVQYSDGLADLPFDPEGFITPSTAALKWTCGRSFFTEQKNYTSYYDPINSIPFSSYRTTAFCAECVGWCQYIDPVSALRVKKEDIPREWPPVSYVLKRGNPAFCSVNLYDVSNDVAAGLDSPVYPQCTAWDTIYGVFPALPADKVRCNILGPRLGQELRAIFRPIVNPLTIGDLRGTAESERIDINCASKCCGCFFKCAPNDEELRNGPYVCPCTYTISYSKTISDTGQWAGMCLVTDTNPFLDVYTGECESYILPVGRVYARPKVNNSGDYSFNHVFNASIDACCGCREGDARGTIQTTNTLNYTCSGPTAPDWDGATYVSPCTVCSSSTFTVEGCGGGGGYPAAGSSHSESESCRYPPDAGPNFQCNLSQLVKTVSDFNATVNNIPCGSISASWSSTVITTRDGPGCGGTLGIYGGGLDEFHTTGNYEENGSYEQGSVTCNACPVGSQNSKTLNYILSWRENSSWICGYSNYSYAYSSAEYGSPVC
jgi:hypothetical protein